MNRNELNAVLARKGYGILNPGKSRGAELECRTGDEPLGQVATEAINPAKLIVRIVSFRRRLLDTDNLASKWHTDALRYAGIIPSDAPYECEIQTTQVKVTTESAEHTLIEIIK